MAEPTGDPILVPCEGSGCPPAGDGLPGGPSDMCAMCGRYPGRSVDDAGRIRIVDHERDDIIARLHRGDFG